MTVPIPAQQPELRVTRYDQVSSWLIALVGGLGLAVFSLTVAWISIQPVSVREPVPVEIVEVSGGVEDGSIEESLQLESPEPETEQATLAEEDANEPEIQETLDNVMDVADEATNQAEKQFEFQTRNAGKKGSASGTGRRALGIGSGKGGVPREQRWYVSYNDRETIEEYGKQIDFFGIELGLLTADGKLIYLSRLAQATPAVRTTNTGKGENRLYMTWQGGARRRADLQLFQRAGIEPGASVLMQFYPPQIEKLLVRLELDFKKRALPEIRRTYFSTRPIDTGYEFFVTRQTYFK
jgi:hypothetical protein